MFVVCWFSYFIQICLERASIYFSWRQSLLRPFNQTTFGGRAKDFADQEHILHNLRCFPSQIWDDPDRTFRKFLGLEIRSLAFLSYNETDFEFLKLWNCRSGCVVDIELLSLPSPM